MQFNREGGPRMFELWARSIGRCRYERLDVFDDDRQFHYKIDCVDREEYSEAMITLPNGGPCLCDVDFKSYGNIKRRVR